MAFSQNKKIVKSSEFVNSTNSDISSGAIINSIYAFTNILMFKQRQTRLNSLIYQLDSHFLKGSYSEE